MRRRWAFAALLVLGLAPSAWAVIKVDFPVSKIYAAAKAIAVGSITAVNPDNRVVEVKVDQTLKGAPAGERLRIQVVNPAALIQAVATGQPAVVFAGEDAGKPVAVVHLADTWLLAEGLVGAQPPAWRVVQPYDAARSFPGRTPALVRLITEMKAGRAALQEEYPDPFAGGARELGSLGVQQPTFLAAVDVNGDRKLDLVAGAAGGVKLFLAAAKGYEDATDAWGLAGVAAAHCAAGDVNGDGKPDLLLGPKLVVNEGGKLAAKAALDLPPEAEWLAVALADATGDKRPDAVVLLRSGKLLVLENPGSADKPWPQTARPLWQGGDAPVAAALSPDWADDGQLSVLVVRDNDVARYSVGPKDGAPADFARLTGGPLAAYKGLGPKPLKAVFTVAFDYDGNEKDDCLIVTQAGGLALVNRGYGSFLATDVLHAHFHATGDKKLPFTVPQIAAVAPGRRVAEGPGPSQNLLVLTTDGRLFEMDSTPK